MQKEVYILIGCSGSGKSTFVKRDTAKQLKRGTATLQVSADLAQDPKKFNPLLLNDAHEACLRAFVDFVIELSAGSDPIRIYVDNTNTRITEIAPYYAVAKAYGFSVSLVYVNRLISIQEAARRNKHGTPESTIQAQIQRISRLEIPHFWKVATIFVPEVDHT